MTEKNIQTVADALRHAERILFVTGAGMSADSGLPTYRGIGGLYNDRLTDDAIAIEDALSGEMMRTRPEITWKYLYEIENACRKAKHNRGHNVIAEIEKAKPGSWVLTQNIDGFHRDAGSGNLIEIHGRFSDLLCTHCDYAEEVSDYRHLALPPVCPECGEVIRPGVVLFGEALPELALEALLREMETGFDLVFSIGTTSVFPYIAQPVMIGRQQGAMTVEINPGDSQVSSYVDFKINASAAETLNTLWELASK